MKEFFTRFLTGNEWYWRLARTIVQGALGVIVANLDMIIGRLEISTEFRAMLVALVMAILSPIMAEIGRGIELHNKEKEEDEEA